MTESYKYQQKKRDFMNNNVKKSEADNKVQIQQINQSISMMQRNLDMIHCEYRKYVSTCTCFRNAVFFDPDMGESYERNQTVAKIDVQSGFKVKGQVDEYYLSTVKPGAIGHLFF